VANISVSYEEIRSAAGRLTAGKDDITSKLMELKNLVDNLINSGFDTDQAGEAFREAYGDFTNGTTNAVNGLEGLSKFLMSAADTLEQTDASLASSIRG
jgi:WXG100 family type VII secretion target